MSTFFTRKGDDGYTGLLGVGRIPKEDLRLEAIGTVDEVTSMLGFARSVSQAPEIPAILLNIQRELYSLMSELAATVENSAKFHLITAEKTCWLEDRIEQISRLVSRPKDFILPGDSLPGAALDMARTTVRRAERRVAALTHEGIIGNEEILRYLNRLSSLCFLLELRENQYAGKDQPTLARSE